MVSSRALQLAQQEATVAKQPLLEITEGMLNDGSSANHHFRMRQHPFFHSFERFFMSMPHDITALRLSASVF